MTISRIGTVQGFNSSTNQSSWTFEVTVPSGSSNRLAVLHVHSQRNPNDNDFTMTATLNGNAMASVVQETLAVSSRRLRGGIFAYLNPTAGTYNVVVTYNGNVNRHVATFYVLEDVDPDDPTGAIQALTSSTLITEFNANIITETANSWIVGSVQVRRGDATFTANGGESEFDEETTSPGDSAQTEVAIVSGYKTTTSATTYNFGFDSSELAVGLLVMAEIKEAPATVGGHAGSLVNARRLKSKLRGLV